MRSEKRDLEKHLAEVRSRLDDAQRDTDSVEQWKSGLDALKSSLDKDPETRPRLNDHLRQYIHHIDIFGKGYPDDFRDGSGFNLLRYFEDVEADCEYLGVKPQKLTPPERKRWNAFERWALTQLQTKQAKFLRVYLKKQEAIADDGKLRFDSPFSDIAPEGSLACSGTAIDTLWEEFKSTKKRPRPR